MEPRRCGRAGHRVRDLVSGLPMYDVLLLIPVQPYLKRRKTHSLRSPRNLPPRAPRHPLKTAEDLSLHLRDPPSLPNPHPMDLDLLPCHHHVPRRPTSLRKQIFQASTPRLGPRLEHQNEHTRRPVWLGRLSPRLGLPTMMMTGSSICRQARCSHLHPLSTILHLPEVDHPERRKTSGSWVQMVPLFHLLRQS
jgi:hypothetical protein